MNVVELQIGQFMLIYLLLLIVLFIMKKYKVDHTKLLITASIKMTVQLVLAGFILTYIFKNPNPIFTIIYLVAMILFTIYRVLSKNKNLNKKFKQIVAASIIVSGLFVIFYFVYLVVGESIVNPQYIIPISGMIMGNIMTGVSLGLKTFQDLLVGKREKINALLSVGASADKILSPFAREAFETAFLPTLNSMLGMGIVSLPGMMTGQILAGTLPSTAIMYQIAIMIAISTAVTCASFSSIFFGYKSMFDKETQII